MTLLDRLRGGRASPQQRMSVDEYAQMLGSFTFNGLSYGYGAQLTSGIQQTLAGGQATEMAPNTFVGLATHAYQANGPVFACMLVRMLVFSSMRFRWRRVRDGKPSDMFGSKDLRILERPWPGGTTQDMLTRMIQDADLAGNSYWFIDNGEFVRLRPDWVDVIVEPRMIRGGRGELAGGQVGWRKVGYLYWEGGHGTSDPVAFLADEVTNFAPIPDPIANYRGMSWLTPIVREIQADQAMSKHQSKFFDNGATPNMIIKHDPTADRDAILRWIDQVESKHAGADNAWKNLNLYPGADATVVGSNLKEIDFGDVRANGEVRIAAAAGVPPVIIGLSKGLDSSTYSNYGQARKRFADGTAHPLWENLAGCLGHLMPDMGPGVDLWYDADNVPFLREDEKDVAEILQVRASTVNALIASGWTPESAVLAVESGDLRVLEHTGLTSVQLLPPGTDSSTAADNPSDGGSDGDN